MMTAFVDLRSHFGGSVPDEIREYARAALAKRHACGSDVDCITGVLLAEKTYFNEHLEQ
jgi:uncharacterized protein